MAKRKKAAEDGKAKHENHNGKTLTESLEDRGLMLLCMVSDAESKYWPYAVVNQKTLERRYFKTREEVAAFASGSSQTDEAA